MVVKQYPMGEKYFASNSCSDGKKIFKLTNFSYIVKFEGNVRQDKGDFVLNYIYVIIKNLKVEKWR